MLQIMTEPESLGQVADDASDVNRQRISGSIRVSARQRGNPVLKHIRKVPWEFAEGMVRDNFVNLKVWSFPF